MYIYIYIYTLLTVFCFTFPQETVACNFHTFDKHFESKNFMKYLKEAEFRLIFLLKIVSQLCFCLKDLTKIVRLFLTTARMHGSRHVLVEGQL